MRLDRPTDPPRSPNPAPPGVSNPAGVCSRPTDGAFPVLSILHTYAGNLYGGIETLLITLARSGHLEPSMRVEFALCFPGRLRDELEEAGAVVHDLGPVKFRSPWTIVRARHRLSGLLKRRRYDAVVTHACWPHAALAPAIRRAGRPIVFWQHDFAGSGHWIERLAAWTRPDLVISNSRATAETLPCLFPDVANEIIFSPVCVANPPADPAGAKARIRRELKTPDDSVVIIQACRMERWKGHAFLLESLSRHRERRDWTAWIVGGAQRRHEREYLAELEAQATGLGIADRVRFLGHRDDVPMLLASADVHCQPNTGPEPLGLAFIEALNAGLPVISTRMGGAIEIVDQDCGILVDNGDVDGLSRALLRMIANPSDRHRLGGAGPGRAGELADLGRMLRRLSITIESMIQSLG